MTPSHLSLALRRLSISLLLVAIVGLVAAIVLIIGVAMRAASDSASAVDDAVGAADGVIGSADGVVSPDTDLMIDDDVPAITGLDGELREAVRQATADAAFDGVSLFVTSGWRSVRYQQQLFDDAVATYGSEALAREFVAPADVSSHITGDAVDIGPMDAQFWLMEHGAAYGLCQMFINERWHFELATTPGGTCPDMLPDASYLTTRGGTS